MREGETCAAVLDSRRLRRDHDFESRVSEILNSLLPEDRCMMPVEMADVMTVFDGARVITWNTLTGDPEACAARAAACLGHGIDRMLLIFNGETLEDICCFQEAIDAVLGPDAIVAYGFNCRLEDEPFQVHMLFPAHADIRVDAPLLLPPDGVLRSRKNTYTGLTAFDAGGTSICYRAVDENGDRVLIKETYPLSLGTALQRENDALVPVSTDPEMRRAVAAMLGSAVERTIRERELESDLHNRGLEFFAKNTDKFEANNTFYTVYNDYGQGTLAGKRGKIPVREALVLTDRVLQLLEELHGAGYLHLDISPENILLSTVIDGVNSLKFIDLGSLIEKRWLEFCQSFPCKDGYSPFELLSAATSGAARRLVGERSDTFSVAAVLYNLLTGRTVDWSVCRRSNREIIPADAPAVCLSKSWQVSFGLDGHIHAAQMTGLSPRVLEQLNEFLRQALSNNPHVRFQSAREMREALHTVLQSLDKHLYYFARMEMPDGFMEADIRKEEEMLGGKDRGKAVEWLCSGIRSKSYAAEDIRRTLESGKGAVLNKCRLADAREAARAYIRQYGDTYQEILFIDESQYSFDLFSGQLGGRHSGMHALDCDENTLMVFYGRREGLKNGIVEMVDGQKQPVYSLEFVRRKDANPHVIRILPSRASGLVSAAAAGSLAVVTALPLLLCLLAVFCFFRFCDSYRVIRMLGVFLHPERDPMGYGWVMLQVREILADCALLGPAAGAADPVYVVFPGSQSLKLLEVMQRWGFLPAGAMMLLTLLGFWASWKKARRSRLSAAAWMVMFSRWLAYVLANTGLLYRTTGDLWTTGSAMAANVLLLSLILIWPQLDRVRKNRDLRWSGWRCFYGVFGHWVFWIIYRAACFRLSGSIAFDYSGLFYLAWSLLFASAVDVVLELGARHAKGSFSDRLFRWLKDDGEDDVWLEEDDAPAEASDEAEK